MRSWVGGFGPFAACRRRHLVAHRECVFGPTGAETLGTGVVLTTSARSFASIAAARAGLQGANRVHHRTLLRASREVDS